MKESKGKDPCTEERKEAAAINDKIDVCKKEVQALEEKLNQTVSLIGNIVPTDVPISKNEDDNKVVSTWGQPTTLEVTGEKLGQLHHHEIMQCLDMVEFERGQKVAGHRGYFLKGVGVLLNQALINYGISFLQGQNKYTTLQPPYFMK